MTDTSFLLSRLVTAQTVTDVCGEPRQLCDSGVNGLMSFSFKTLNRVFPWSLIFFVEKKKLDKAAVSSL